MLGLVLIGFGTAMVLSTNAPSGSGEVDAQFWVDRLIEENNDTDALNSTDTSTSASVIATMRINGTSVQDLLLLPSTTHTDMSNFSYFEFIAEVLPFAANISAQREWLRDDFWDVVYSLCDLTNNGKKHEFLFGNKQIIGDLQNVMNESYCSASEVRAHYNDHFTLKKKIPKKIFG